MSTSNTKRRAYSLTEVVIATGLVGVVLVAALETVGGATRTWIETSNSCEAETLTHDLMAEILGQAYSDPDTTDDPDLENWGVETGEPTATNRSAFDDLDDYDDWSASPPQSRDGTPLAGRAGWTRSVVVGKLKKRKSDDTHNNDTHKDDGARLITVTVDDGAGETVTLQAIRSVMGALEQTPGLDTDVVTDLSVSLTTTEGETTEGATRLLNHASAPTAGN